MAGYLKGSDLIGMFTPLSLDHDYGRTGKLAFFSTSLGLKVSRECTLNPRALGVMEDDRNWICDGNIFNKFQWFSKTTKILHGTCLNG